MCGVEPVLVSSGNRFALHDGSVLPGNVRKRVEERDTCNALSMPLLPAFANADRFEAIGARGGAQLGMHQPQYLCEKRQQQQSREKLRAAEALAREISAHKGESSVLPCWRG